MRPHFVIIGAQKAGTTSLFFYLRDHPRVVPGYRKEIHHFDRAVDLGSLWYRAHFPVDGSAVDPSGAGAEPPVTGEATPSYILAPRAPARIARSVPEAKLIALLRDPVRRAHSQYRMLLDRGRYVGRPSFAKVVDWELRLLRRPGALMELCPSSVLLRSVVARGLYVFQLRRWRRALDAGRLLLLRSEELAARPDEVYGRVLDFLELPEHHLSEYRRYLSQGDEEIPGDVSERLAAFYRPYNRMLTDEFGIDVEGSPDAGPHRRRG